MKKLLAALALAAFFGFSHAYALPIVNPPATNEIVPIACKPGTPNCVTDTGNRPKFCGDAGNPCVIDGGLGSDCQGNVTCGTPYQGKLGDTPKGSKAATPQTPQSGATTPKQPVQVK